MSDLLKEEKKKKKKMAVMTTSKGLEFAKKQLKKHGWKKGKGLGKEENGIAEALKVKIKCNTAGVGHDSAEEFTYHWWDHLFNSSAANITVEAEQDGVQVRKVSEREEPVTRTKPCRTQKGNMLYGRFVKAATLISGTEEPMSPVSSADQEEEKLDLSTARRLTDQELFQACGGRTVHKGARHGITMRAKLARLEEQEKAFLASSVQRKDGPGTAPSACPDPQRSSQAKKHTRSKMGCYREEPGGGSCLKPKKKRTNSKKLNGH
ncbi:G patch domain-containing protein 4 [Ahaetulla prasina]|uniref:G patch domain-containing protein 4 n=1 Tax=Ahaetulla prasina TaxID=499056 RepID=UPI002648FF09|nr:G patch domain-containing protein 4 [Ahaetulla prasina]XP_058011272.1 G patch domain-containing protein 4 [Ahaetulla prasina]XP_058011273.1 G patch domain-containing protein 4 [Ahaetulla prasina]